jgi:hypothetical protein
LPERGLFPGAVILILAGLALSRRLGPARTAYLVALGVMFEISLGSHGTVYPLLYQSLSFMRGLRVPARASLLVGLALSVLSGFAVQRLLETRSASGRRALLSALTALIAVDLWPTLHLDHVWKEPPPIYASLAGRHDVVMAEFPLGLSPGGGLTDTPEMYFSLWHWAQLINGYSGHAPDGYDDFLVAMRTFPDPDTIDLLRGRGTTHVSVNCVFYDDRCDNLLDQLSHVPDLQLLNQATWEGKPVRLYQLLARHAEVGPR